MMLVRSSSMLDEEDFLSLNSWTEIYENYNKFIKTCFFPGSVSFTNTDEILLLTGSGNLWARHGLGETGVRLSQCSISTDEKPAVQPLRIMIKS